MIHETALIHPKADVDSTAAIGELTRVWANAGVLQHVTIGKGCSVGRGAEIGRGSVVGDRSRIGWNVFLPPRSVVGARVFIGPGTICCDDKQPRVPMPGESASYLAMPPVIEDDAVIGAGVVLLPGVRIGKGAFIGAGAVVTKDVEDGVTVTGLPARPFMPRTAEMAVAGADSDE